MISPIIHMVRLGLPIVHAIAIAHGAQLNLYPVRTGGLSVDVRFPRART